MLKILLSTKYSRRQAMKSNIKEKMRQDIDREELKTEIERNPDQVRSAMVNSFKLMVKIGTKQNKDVEREKRVGRKLHELDLPKEKDRLYDVLIDWADEVEE